MMAVCVLLANAFAAGPEEKAPEPALPRTAPIVPITAEEPIIKDPVDPEAWNLILVNPWNPLPENYSFTKKELSNGHAVDERCYPDLQAMMDACRAAGNSPVICSSYRSYEKQQSLYQNKVNRLAAQGYSQEKAREEAAKAVALPGTSEHQLGLAVDIVDIANQNLDSSQEDTAVQQWLMEHSWEYGFILRYPNDKSDITGIIYEPWHYRYVGKDAAAEIYQQGLCLEEYLEP
ncbi:MAG: M15 family metallopeptidase [Oscillospiraceae bacterium]|nr:M15 family metallopeptidase [Oscillospiraceae bacterium]